MALVSKTFSQIITFTRASTATYFNSSGVLTSAAIDAPRFDYNPSTLAAQGLLIEEARTNLLLQSEDFSTTWVTGAPYSVSTNTEIAPDGLQTADSLIVASGQSSFNTNVTRQVVSKAASAIQYTRSAFCKALGATTSVRFVDFGALSSENANVTVSLVDGSVVVAPAVSGSFSGASVAVSNAGNGWWRVSFTYTTDTHTSLTVRSFPYVGGTVLTGDGTSGLYIWGAQLEAGAFPTSYIPTTTTALTRSADVASVNTLAPWYNATSGTLYAEASLFGFGTTPAVTSFSDGTDTGNLIQTNTSGAGLVRYRVTIGGVAQVNNLSSGVTATANTTFKAATGYAASDFAISVNGTAAVTQASGNVPTPTRLRLLQTGSGGSVFSGYLRRITYYPRKLSSAELQAITA